jgi:hypothetical protein
MVLAGKLDHLLAANFPGTVHAGGYRAQYADAAAGLGQQEPRPSISQGLPS